MGYRGYIDGLRGIAVLVIFIFHLNASLMPGGFIGVDIFFVISGYLITGIIIEDVRAGRFSFTNFYARRIKRIFPALFVMLFFASIAAVLSLGLEAFTDFFRSLRGASAQLANIYFNRNVEYFVSQDNIEPLLHTWSLGVEEQFYAVWPLLLVLLYKARQEKFWRPVLVVIFIISLGISQYLVHTDPKSAFYMLHSRAWELALGGLVVLSPAYFKKNVAGLLSLLGFALMIIPAFFYTSENFPGIKALVPCLGVALLLYAGHDMNVWCRRFLNLRPLILTGLISYSLYLWHWPLIAFYKLYTGADLTIPAQASIFLLSFMIASLSYVFVEQPIRRMKVRPVTTIGAGCCIILCFIVAAQLIKKERDSAWRISYAYHPLEREPHDLEKVCSEEGAYEKEKCIIGPNPQNYEVILAGDSTGSHYTPMILGWAKARGLTVHLFTRSACATWLQSDNPYRYGRPDLSCTQMIDDFYSTLKNDKSIRYIFLGKNLPDATPEAEESLAALKKFNIPVYFLGSGPRFEVDPHLCNIRKHVLLSKLILHDNYNKDCIALHPDLYNGQLETLTRFREALTKNGFFYFDPMPHMQPPYDKKGHFMFLDDYHINRFGSTHLIPAFTEYMKTHPAR